MEITRWRYYVLINCVVIIPYLLAKPVSLNEFIAAEERKQISSAEKDFVSSTEEVQAPVKSSKGSRRHNPDTTAEHLHKKGLATKFIKKSKLTDTIAKQINKKKKSTEKLFKQKINKETDSNIQNNKISPFKYRKVFQITSPLRPKKLKHSYKPRHSRIRNQSFKREIKNNDKFNHKYIPLLKSLGLLFDNLIKSDSSESYKRKRNKYKQYRQVLKSNSTECPCALNSTSNIINSKSQKKAVALVSVVSSETTSDTQDSISTEITSTPAYNTTVSDISSIGPNKSISILLARNSSSGRGDSDRLDEGSSSTFHKSFTGNLTGLDGHNQHSTECRDVESDTGRNEKDSHSTTRNSTDSYSTGGEISGNRSDLQVSNNGHETSEIENSTRHVSGIKGEDKHETNGDETKGPVFIPEPDGRLRGFAFENEIDCKSETLQSKESHETGTFSVRHVDSGHKRISDGSSAATGEDQEVYATNETVISINDLSNRTIALQDNPKSKMAVVMIIDGYSVARDKNGENKLSEKTIRIHS